jgi:hypothetical protein
VEDKNFRQPPVVLVSIYERIIQLNEWLDKYRVRVVL